MSVAAPEHEVLVIGSGFSGIGMGIRLKTAGIHSFAILERASDLGGTSRDNTYPGIAVDITSLATGYNVYEKGNLPAYAAYGRNGLELGDFWHRERFQAYQGVTVHGFPNFFTIVGPYGVTGASWFSIVEAQTTHALRCIEEARRRRATLVEIRKEHHDRYFREMLRRVQNTVFFNHACGAANSYYFDHHGDAPFLRPSSGLEMAWDAAHFPFDHYRFDTLTPMNATPAE